MATETSRRTRDSSSPFLRRIAVTLGPLEEWRGLSGGGTIRFEADGTPGGLKVTAQVQRTLMGMPQPASISIYNLARDTRDAIRAGLTKITVEAGWSNDPLHKLFQGSVRSAVSERSGTEIVTKISAIPGFGGITRGVSTRTFVGGTPVREVVKTLAADMPGIIVGDGGIEGIKGAINPGGWTVAGSTRDALTQLATEYGFSWHVDDGRFRALGDLACFGNLLTLNGRNGGLISVTPNLSGALQEQTGVSIKAVYVPGVKAGSRVRVAGEVAPKLNGEYRVHTVNISVDAYSDQWTMDIESFTNT